MRIHSGNLTWDDSSRIGLDNIITDPHAINKGVGKTAVLFFSIKLFCQLN